MSVIYVFHTGKPVKYKELQEANRSAMCIVIVLKYFSKHSEQLSIHAMQRNWNR